MDIHVANDGHATGKPGCALRYIAMVRLRCRNLNGLLDIPGHTTLHFGVEDILGRFFDAAYAYRFGPQGHDLIATSLHARSRRRSLCASLFVPPLGEVPSDVPSRNWASQSKYASLTDGTIQMLFDAPSFRLRHTQRSLRVVRRMTPILVLSLASNDGSVASPAARRRSRRVLRSRRSMPMAACKLPWRRSV